MRYRSKIAFSLVYPLVPARLDHPVNLAATRFREVPKYSAQVSSVSSYYPRKWIQFNDSTSTERYCVSSRLHKTNSAGELIFAVRKSFVVRTEILVGRERVRRDCEILFTRWLGNLSVCSLLTNEKRNEWRAHIHNSFLT